MSESEKDQLTLFGLKMSVYTRVVRMILVEKGVDYSFQTANPFNDPPDAPLPDLTRFNRIPVLRHGEFVLHETQAIAQYLEAVFPEPALEPGDPRALARMFQVIAIIDSYGYWPLVRQVFAHRVFRPLEGEPPNAEEVAKGLTAAAPVLDTLNDIATEGHVLNCETRTLCDLHLAPMISYFCAAPEGLAALSARPDLARWWHWIRDQGVMTQTRPEFSGLLAY